MKSDLYERFTGQIVASLELGIRPWMKPWSADHAAERITRPLRSNGIPYQGINVLMLWAEATDKGYAAPLWLTFEQALGLGGTVRKGEKGTRPRRRDISGALARRRILADLVAAQPCAPSWEKMKKADLATLAERKVAGIGWLPELLR